MTSLHMSRTSLRYSRQEFEAKIKILVSSLQIPTSNLTLYILACVHRSVLNEERSGFLESNERLEYLGDAVLELVVTERLFLDFPWKTEWELTDIRSALVRWRNLAEIALWLGISDAIQLSRWESLANGQDNPYILANTFEAIIGAIYLDCWIEQVKNFLSLHVYSTLEKILEKWLYVDPKSYLQEFTQAVWGLPPLYEVMSEVWQDHNKTYVVSVSLDGIEFAQWTGSSKKKAEQDAAENAVSAKSVWEWKVNLPKKVTVVA